MEPASLVMITESGSGIAQAVIDAVTTTIDPHVSSVTMPWVLEYAAVVSGALSGAMVACERKLDVVGIIVLAMVTSLGGGLLRDMILPTTEIYMMDNPSTMVTSTVVALIVFFFRSAFRRGDSLIFIFDILAVALFAFAGADKTLRLGMDYGFLDCVLMGTITAVGGGMLRDICLGEVPSIFRRGPYYAIAAVAGATVYMALVEVHVVKSLAAIACVVVTIALRIASVHFNIQSATPVDLTPKVAVPLKRAWHAVRHSSHDPLSAGRVESTQVERPAQTGPMPAVKPGFPLQQKDDPDADTGSAAGGGTEAEDAADRSGTSE